MWKHLPRNNRYLVSDKGEIYSLNCNRILSPKRNWDGYLRIQIWSKCSCEFVSVHRLVAETYLPTPPETHTVINHKNGIKWDNRVENLEWVTQQENIKHAWRTGLATTRLNRAGKPVRQITLDGKEVRTYPSQSEVERVLGINHAIISRATRTGEVIGGYRWEVV